MGTEALRLRL